MDFRESSLLVNPNAAPIKSEHRASRIRTPRDSNPNTAPSRILWISRMSRASRHSLAFTGSSLKHLSVTGTCLMRALCEIHMLLRDMCARTLHDTFMLMHADFTRCAKFNVFLREICARDLHEISHGCARRMHAYFTSWATSISFCGNCAHAVCMRFHASVYAGCMQISRLCEIHNFC